MLLGFGVGHWLAVPEPAERLGLERRRRGRRWAPPLDCVGLRRREEGGVRTQEWVGEERETGRGTRVEARGE